YFAGRFSEVLADRLRRIGRAGRSANDKVPGPDNDAIRLRDMPDRPLGRVARVAEEGQLLTNELIHVAPGDAHLCVGQQGARVLVRLDRKCAPSGCLPSVDPMLASVADIYGERAIGVILSGMGRDGLVGSQRIVELGGA